jgi:mannose-6-phosphate isomerase-like protein (cupin superfamily)
MAMNLAWRLRASGIGLILLVSPVARTEPMPPPEAIPPVEQASFHQLMFANEDIAVLNNLYQPGGDSGWHAHYRDLFYVVIQSQPQSSQRPGNPLAPSPVAPVGAAGYSPVGSEPRVHRVVNGDKGISQFIVVELRRPTPLGNVTPSREAAPQYMQIVDNPRMRAWRLILEPGQSVPAISQGGNGVRVVVRGGSLTTTTPGAPDQTLALRPGDFALQQSGATRALRNSGTQPIELVEMELK